VNILLVPQNAVRVLPLETARAVEMDFTVSNVHIAVLASAHLDAFVVNVIVMVAKQSVDAKLTQVNAFIA